MKKLTNKERKLVKEYAKKLVKESIPENPQFSKPIKTNGVFNESIASDQDVVKHLFKAFEDFADRGSFDSIINDTLSNYGEYMITDYKISKSLKRIILTIESIDEDGDIIPKTKQMVEMSFKLYK